MAKTMARIEDGIVVNIEWFDDRAVDSDTLKDTEDRGVGIGDAYIDGKFYWDGEELLTTAEKAAMYEKLINELYEEVAAE